MDFQQQGLPLSDGGMDRVCALLGVTESEVWAVLTVETRGFGFLTDRRPQILFERHIFRRRTQGNFDDRDANISNRKPGGYTGGAGEYVRLEKAMGFDREAALESASWGIGQVMGFNSQVAGFSSVETMVQDMVKDEDAQLLGMAHFIKGNNLAGALQRGNWAAFARGYNGRDYKKNEYDTRLAAAHAKYQRILPDLSLRGAQAALRYLGFDPGPIDGLSGRRTRAALIAYQERAGLPETGDLDDDTEDVLRAEAFPA